MDDLLWEEKRCVFCAPSLAETTEHRHFSRSLQNTDMTATNGHSDDLCSPVARKVRRCIMK